MNEIRLVLSLKAMEQIAQGFELSVTVDGRVICLRADEATVNVFQQHVQKALLELLPISNTQH